ncbi:probable nucleoside diphosphate kinase 5 [Rhinatrema bivittatum]|uniref:probable nucleoside diphosphate kinase 5 n=1 Tax=Rhinatrema bivittatum TaxID=194408 RepID=UPI001125D988|nr:probable nucleoside diphosphate kinase 5 [Rhinatrema bivittatum]
MSDEIMNRIKEAGFAISHMKEMQLTREMAVQFYNNHEEKPYFNELVDYMSEGPLMIMTLSKRNAVEEWRNLMGPTDPELAKETSPNSLRAQFAKSILENAVHGSSNTKHAIESIELLLKDIIAEEEEQITAREEEQPISEAEGQLTGEEDQPKGAEEDQSAATKEDQPPDVMDEDKPAIEEDQMAAAADVEQTAEADEDQPAVASEDEPAAATEDQPAAASEDQSAIADESQPAATDEA